MNVGLLKNVVSVLLAISAVVYGSPVRAKRSSDTVEFFMKKTLYDQINWHSICTDQILDAIRQSSERAFGNPSKCPAKIKTDRSLPDSARSTCPWYYEVDHNPSRYPANILKAVTPCTDTCIGGTDYHQCLPVVRTIETLTKKGDESGSIKFETMEEPITVGFTCGARYMAENPGKSTTTSAPVEEPIWDAR